MVSDIKNFIREVSRGLGFHAVGFARATHLTVHATRFRQWLAADHHGAMEYMQRWVAVRSDPRHPGMLDGARTVVSLAMAYSRQRPDQGLVPHLAMYARGPDYHLVLRQKLRALIRELRKHCPSLRARALVDTAPLLERAWAVEAGLGWFGRNTCVINPTLGSTFVLGEIVMDEAVEPDEPLASRCGDCRLCLEACPARALSGGEGFVLDARRCLSYWTVETDRVRSPLPGGGDTFFGCDRCQLVCPWNRSDLTVETTLAPLERWQRLTLPLFAEADLETLNEMLRGTALERVGAAALRRRAAALTQSSSSSVPGSSSSGNGCSSCQR